MDSELLHQSLFWGSGQLKAGPNLIGEVGVLLATAKYTVHVKVPVFAS